MLPNIIKALKNANEKAGEPQATPVQLALSINESLERINKLLDITNFSDPLQRELLSSEIPRILRQTEPETVKLGQVDNRRDEQTFIPGLFPAKRDFLIGLSKLLDGTYVHNESGHLLSAREMYAKNDILSAMILIEASERDGYPDASAAFNEWKNDILAKLPMSIRDSVDNIIDSADFLRS